MNTYNPPIKKNICAIFVAFNPDRSFPQRVRALVPQVDLTIIIDNNSTPQTFASIENVSIPKNVEIIKNSENVGLAKALNQGARYALKNGYQWMLTMDQDSLADPHMVEELINGYCTAKHDGIQADLIGVNFIYENTREHAFSHECIGREYVHKRNIGIQTSGSLLSLYAYERVGPFCEYFFIDYIDTEYCIRLQKKKFNTIIACKARMLHNISNRYIGMRRYYRWRNWFIIAVKHPIWALKNAYEKKKIRGSSAL